MAYPSRRSFNYLKGLFPRRRLLVVKYGHRCNWARRMLRNAHRTTQLARRLGRVRCTVCEGVLVQELGSRSLEVLGGSKCFTSGNNLVAPPKRSVV